MITTEINGISLALDTLPELFSPSAVDSGTLAMLSAVKISPHDRVLDIGCGCGVVGIYASKLVGAENVTMCDISPEAVRISKENALRNGVEGVKIYQSDGFSGLPADSYTLILSNPPYHTDFSVAKSFIEGGFRHLETGGRMAMVTKRREWYENKLRSVFGGVRVFEVGGYFVFVSEKRAERRNAKKQRGGMSGKLKRKYGL